jgi:hypothetical protein
MLSTVSMYFKIAPYNSLSPTQSRGVMDGTVRGETGGRLGCFSFVL